jgi:hypothetical protein
MDALSGRLYRLGSRLGSGISRIRDSVAESPAIHEMVHRLLAFIALFNGQDDLFLLLWMALSFALLAQLTDSRINPGMDHMPNLHSLFAGAPFSLSLQIAASLLLAAGVYLAARRNLSFESALGLALGAGLLAGYHGYVHDGALFLPALIGFSSAAAAYARIPAILLITPIPWCILQLTKPFPVVTQFTAVDLCRRGNRVAGGIPTVQ